ncbi:hypothetical protein [Cellulomonas bogoriensis]|uniref:PE domain-containing protein n=1 Tax=Cellulomonas bogoriensis 69B4 = DSM 16987 TaxID=1386082 RepID=A0A0A0BVC6_9CELL|nr:hypothetical protein [Cellulomonas bogoriensis]KGM12333.1 hypothetical protein N869_16975 [Cellulomonas bogoriensis 69B4 = DSM 16987]
MTGFEVDLDLVRRAARHHEDLAQAYADLDTRRAAAGLERGALGKLPESDAIHAAFEARYHGLGEALAALQEIYRNIGDGLVATADGYLTSDDAVAALLATYSEQVP